MDGCVRGGWMVAAGRILFILHYIRIVNVENVVDSNNLWLLTRQWAIYYENWQTIENMKMQFGINMPRLFRFPCKCVGLGLLPLTLAHIKSQKYV